MQYIGTQKIVVIYLYWESCDTVVKPRLLGVFDIGKVG
jgi:hypothetical protein